MTAYEVSNKQLAPPSLDVSSKQALIIDLIFSKLMKAFCFLNKPIKIPIVILSMPTTDHRVSSGGHQWYHISPGPANGKAVC